MRILEVTPSPCLLCGTGNVPRSDKAPRRFLDLERDTHWDDPAVLCEDCVLRAGAMLGMLSIDALKNHKRDLKKKEQEIHDLNAEIDSMKRRARKAGMEFAA